jgi:uncharacterized membrane protein (UPF0127 family)
MRTLTLLLVALVMSACSGASDDPVVQADSSTTSETPTSSQPEEIAVPHEIADFRVKQVQVGDRDLTLAIADSPSLRQQGLQRVADLEDLDGMLFFWRHDGDAFWMKDTVIPLDIVWFNEDGTYKGRASMVPCTEDPCATYQPADGLDFRYAIEAPPGTLDWVADSTVIVYTDD